MNNKWSVCLISLLAGMHSAEGKPIAHWSFDAERPVGWNNCSSSETASQGVQRDTGIHGGAARFDGRAAISLPPASAADIRNHFTIECWFRAENLDKQSGAWTIASRENQFLLRIDPAHRGRNISFFVNIDGTLEPRAKGIPARPRHWHHVIAIWWGKGASLWVDGVETTSPRSGDLPHSTAPVVIGGSAWRPDYGSGFHGLMDEVAIYPHAQSRKWVATRNWLPFTYLRQTETAATHFSFPRDQEHWTALYGAAITATEAGSIATFNHPGARIVANIAGTVPPDPVMTLKATATQEAILTVVAITENGVVKRSALCAADRKRSTTRVDFSDEAWTGRIQALGIQLRGRPGKTPQLLLETIKWTRQNPEPEALRLGIFAPEKRYNALAQPATIIASCRNDGGTPARATVALRVPDRMQILSPLPAQTLDINPGKETQCRWSIVSATPVTDTIRLRIESAGTHRFDAETQITFTADPGAAAARVCRQRPALRAPYPRAMDFRHLIVGAEARFADQNVLLVDFIGEKIEAARSLKKRYPESLVLMQVNDEPNGLWGSWFTVPEACARKEGLRCRPNVFPMPDFKGYWLLRPGAVLSADFPAEKGETRVRVPHPERFVQRRFKGRRSTNQDVLVIPLRHNHRDWLGAEYMSVNNVDIAAKSITLKRWPRTISGTWHAFQAEKAVVAPSAGDVYQINGREIRTWVPNLTIFSPKDPRNQLDACEWWARHFANLWHKTIARDTPHPDGYQFDWPPWRAHKPDADCNNDGVPDGGEMDGISYWGLGMHRCFHLLRNGNAGPNGWKGIGADALVISDCSNTRCQRSMDLLNGSENEEFAGFGHPEQFASQFDLYRTWTQTACTPRISYLQSRFQTHVYHDGSLNSALQNPKFRFSGDLRLAIAVACMYQGVHTYRPGGRNDIRRINGQLPAMRYDLDEYHAGKLYRFGWLGQPASPPKKLETATHGPPLWQDTFEQKADWTLQAEHDRVQEVTLEWAPQPQRENVLRIAVGKLLGQRIRQTAASAISPGIPAPAIRNGQEVTLSFEIRADPVYDEREGDLYAGIHRDISIQMCAGARQTDEAAILAGPKWRPVHLTLKAPGPGPLRVRINIGSELGPVFLDNLILTRGCANVLWRPFEYGLVLMNGSQTTPYTFDVATLCPGKTYYRLDGIHTPYPNDGSRVDSPIAIEPQDAIFLIARNAP